MTPLTSQVEALASPPTEKINNIREEADSKIKPKNVTFQLSPQHIDKDSTKWRATPRHIKMKDAPKSGKCKTPQNTTEKTLIQDDIRTGILNETIPSAISGTGAT